MFVFFISAPGVNGDDARSPNMLEIEDRDLPDGSPLLDFRPYVPVFDLNCDAKAGWFDTVSHNATSVRSGKWFLPVITLPDF